jgi:ketosteroid isomerase-like protein
MKTFILLASLLLVWIARSQPAPVPTRLDATAAITALRTGLVDSFVKGDIDRLLTYLDPDVVVTWQNGEVCKGPEAVRAYHQRMMTGEGRVVKSITADPEILGRHVDTDWAVSWGNLHDDFTLADGTHLPLNTLFTATIARRGDQWLVTGFHASVNAFDNPILALALRKTAIWTGFGAGLVGLVLGVVLTRLLARRPASGPATAP